MGGSASDVRSFNVADPAFSVRSPEIRVARDDGWYVRTNYGIAVLRYDQVDRLLPDRRVKERIGGFGPRGRCEFVSEFAEPYATRVICRLMGLPESEWETFARWSATIGLGLGVTIAQDLPRIEEALAGLFD